MSQVGDALDDILGIARSYVAGGGVRVSVKTNFGPELSVYAGELSRGASGGQGGGFSLSRLVGLKAAVIVRDGRGATIATYGDYPATEPLRAVLALLALGALGFVLVRGVLK